MLPCSLKNAAERAIRAYKNYLMPGLSGTYPSFTVILWETLIPQAKITINLLRNSRANTKLSACAQIFGQFDCNKTPLAPPGCKWVLHKNTPNRKTWADHRTKAYCAAPDVKYCQWCEVCAQKKLLTKHQTQYSSFLKICPCAKNFQNHSSR